MHILLNTQTAVGQNKEKIIGTDLNAACQGNFSAVIFDTPAISSSAPLQCTVYQTAVRRLPLLLHNFNKSCLKNDKF